MSINKIAKKSLSKNLTFRVDFNTHSISGMRNKVVIPTKLLGPPNTFFLENALNKNYWIFSQISFFIRKYNPYGE